MTTALTVPRWLYIDGKGSARINGRNELTFDLPKQWNLGDLEYAFKQACLKFILEIPDDEDEIHRIILEATKSFGKRTVLNSGDSKANSNQKLTPQEQAFELAEFLKTAFDFRTMNDTKEIYYFESGRYILGGERLIEIECAKVSPDVTTAIVNETTQIIRRTTPVNRDEFDKDIFIINLKNGLLDLRSGQLGEHRPEYLSIIQLPVNYERKASCNKIVHFLFNIMLNPNDVPLVLEYIAYCLLRNARLQKHLLVVGEEDNGKSVLLALIRAFLGKENIGTKTLYQLTSNRFATSALFGRLANLFADISAKKLEDIETFKSLGGIDRISAEKKGKDSFDFDPTAKLIFSCNVPPRPNESMDDPFYRRWLLIQTSLRKTDYFDRRPIVRDKSLLEKLTSDQELSGLLNLVIVSAKRVFTKWSFCKDPDTAEIRDLYERLADPVKAWIDERCILGKAHETDKEKLHSDYIDYCWKKNYRRLPMNALGRQLANYGIHDVQRGSGKSRRHLWSGISLAEEDD